MLFYSCMVMLKELSMILKVACLRLFAGEAGTLAPLESDMSLFQSTATLSKVALVFTTVNYQYIHRII